MFISSIFLSVVSVALPLAAFCFNLTIFLFSISIFFSGGLGCLNALIIDCIVNLHISQSSVASLSSSSAITSSFILPFSKQSLSNLQLWEEQFFGAGFNVHS